MSDPTTPESPPTPGKAWWAPTMGRMTLRAKLATCILAAALVVITGVVWNTPAVSGLRAAVTDEKPVQTAEEARLARENAAMRDELATSRAQAGSLREALDKEQAARLKGEQEKAATEAAAAAGGSGAGSGGSSPRSSTTTRTSASKAANPSNPSQPPGKGTPVVTKPTAPSKTELLTPGARYFGLYTEQAPFSWSTLDDAAQKVTRTPNLVGYFSGWDKPFRADAIARSWERGMLPMLTWESRPSTSGNDVIVEPDYTLPQILGDPAAGVAGRYDDYLHQYARDVAALGLPLAIRFDHEMNGIWYPWSEQTGTGASINGNRVGDYAATWRHVHDIFEAEGANDLVIWVWAPNIVNNLPTALQGVDTLAGLYPGDAYVDWVGVSGYYRPPYKIDNDNTFTYTYGRTLDLVRSLTDKPILLAEVGASEIGGKKPTWVRSFFEAFTRPANSDLIGFAWFNMAVSTYSEGQLITNDWRVDSRRTTLAEFVAGVNNPAARFGGKSLAAVAEPDAGASPEDSLEKEPAPAAATATPTVKPTATATATPTVKPTATATATARPASTPRPSSTTRSSATPTATSAPRSTASPTPSPTASPTEETS
ncbi:glycoside hydrolase family 26 protein [Cellulomonas sp. P22]|uniref:glycoside hydrolase family 26 protein n=1 Tax=Cellulomonas sp. P22 TaxID=3373189 RepID=UPI0037BA4612